ncbi:MAG: ATP-dependent protease LonB, partial [Candidatus Micrarchaeota archaeon]|nr:ATP-dependent protease LonB [Candidatus Micrarchaeota archaeon]
GALLGDVKHDPLQTGGLGTPAHLRVEAGAIHKANKGVLFIDEIASLKMNWQSELLTAIQERKYPITGQSELSSGALVKTEPAPSDFVLVAAGNLPDLQHIHPALRSRIRGEGYEIYVEDSMDDNEENEEKIARFVAQEVKKDGRIPPFTFEAVQEVIEEARRLSGRRKKFTLNFREIGGLVRAAGDFASEEGAKYVDVEHIRKGRTVARPIESQVVGKIVEQKKEYQIFPTTGHSVGKVNGLAVIGDAFSGIVLPIVAEVTPSSSKSGGKIIATGKLGVIAKEAVENVSAIIKKYTDKDLSEKDIHIQFLQTYEGVEGDSASISIAVAVISDLEGIPVDNSYAMTGSLSVRGEVLPVGGVTAKVEAAYDAGITKVLIPKANVKDVYLRSELKGKVKIYEAENILDVLTLVLKDCPEKKRLLAEIKKQFH